MNTLKALLLSAIALVGGCGQQEAKVSALPSTTIMPVPIEVTVSLAACLSAHECIPPVTNQVVKGETIHQVVLTHEEMTIVYFYTSSARFGVTTKNSKGLLLMEDFDFDGTLDRVTFTDAGDKSKVRVFEPGSSFYEKAQLTYQDAMGVAKRMIIPDGYFDVWREEERHHKEEEERRRERLTT